MSGQGTNVCGATNRAEPGTCKLAAGWGTPHPGRGRCRKHGGSTPAQVTKDNREQAEAAVVTYGLPREIEPGQALLEEVHRSAGHVAWLGAVMAELPHSITSGGVETSYSVGEKGDLVETHASTSGLKQVDGQGKFERPSVWVELYQSERRHLVAVAKAAVDAGIAERQVRIAEDQGRLLAAGLSWLLAGLGRSEDPRARELVATMLRSLALGQVPALEAAAL